MITIKIPGYRTLCLQNLLLDYNGTIALDGEIPEPVREQLLRLSEEVDIYVLTADTHGTAAQICADLLMCRDAALSVAVIGPEGAHGRLLSDADVCVTSINDGLDLLLKPKRLIASLRG